MYLQLDKQYKHILTYKESLCTAYKYTVQTEQAMNLAKGHGAGP